MTPIGFLRGVIAFLGRAVEGEFTAKLGKIKDKFVPYQNIPDAPGKTCAEIKKLGKQFFPFTPHSFQLAMCVYNWTTASFARMVFLKVFEYTGLKADPDYPLNESEVAKMIWESNWKSYTPKNKDYMNSFLMKPAASLDVKKQLEVVSKELQKFSVVENRLLSAAISALPRTSVSSKGRLYSGQVDIYQFGLDRFGTEFLECPLNKGPVSESIYPLMSLEVTLLRRRWFGHLPIPFKMRYIIRMVFSSL